MKRQPQRGNINSEDYSLVEARLRAALTPIAPRSEYIAGVRKRLSSLPVQKRSRVDGATITLTVLGIISGALAVITSIRAILAIIGIVELIRHMRGQSNTKRTAAA